MSVHLYGHGEVYQEGQTTPSGTWTTSGPLDNTLTYDENPQGPGGNDKTFQWTEPGAYYLSSDSLSKVEYSYEGVIEGKKTWRWKEYARGNTSDPWPTQPTATGTVTKS